MKSYQKHDWNALKLEYMQNNISLNDLARQHGIRPSYLREVAATNCWTKAKETFEQEVSIKQAELVGDKLAKLAVERKKQCLEVYCAAFTLARKDLHRLIVQSNQTGEVDIQGVIRVLDALSKARMSERLELGELANIMFYTPPVKSDDAYKKLTLDELQDQMIATFDRIAAAKQNIEKARQSSR